MAGYASRQSTYTSGDTITAAHSNDEFNQVLAAFHATTGHSHDGTAGEGGPVSVLRDEDSLNKILVDTTNNHLEFYVEVSSAAVEQIKIQDGAIVPVTDNDIDLGTSSLEFKDAFFDGTVTTDAASIASLALASGATVTAINDEDDMSSNSATALATQQSIKAYVDSQVTAQDLDLTSDSGTIAIDLDSETLTIQGTSNEIETSATGNALTIGLPNNVTIGNNLTVTGDLTVSGDDITMATNTSGNLLIADGTNFNSVAVGSLSEISTVANDDVFLAVDTSGGGLKKISRSTVVSGLATSSAISNVVEDTTPQLGGNLDMNGQDIVTTSNANIELAPNGTGTVVIKGNTNQGALVLNCESNSHGQKIQPQPHSVGSSAVHTLPDLTGDLIAGKFGGTNFSRSFLIGHATTGTLSSAEDNLGIGDAALNSVTSGDQNICLGSNAGTAITTASANVYIGRNSGSGNATGSSNFGLGVDCLEDGSFTGSSNVAIGRSAGAQVESGNFNIVIGQSAGDNITTGHGNLIIGANVDADSATDSRQLKIAGHDGSTTTTWISGNSDGDLTFAHDVILANDSFIQFGDAGETIAGDGTDLTITTSNDITVDAANDITLDAGGGDVFLKDDGTQFLRMARDGNFDVNFICNQDKAFEFNGNDGGAGTITGLKIDIAAAGEATFNAGIVIADAGNIGSASDKDAMAIASNGVVTFSQTPVNSAGAAFVTDDPTALAIALG